MRALTDALSLALADVDGGWAPEQRADFAAGPDGSLDRLGVAELKSLGDIALIEFSREQAPSALTTAAVGVTPAVSWGTDQAQASVLVEGPSTIGIDKTRGDPAPRARRWRQLIAGGVVALCIAALVTAVILGRQMDSPVSSGRFAIPEPDSPVASPLDVRGSASVAADEELWLLIKPRNNYFYTVTNEPTPVTVDANGDWVVQTVGVGKDEEDVGKRYELYLVSSPQGGPIAAAVRQKSPDRHSVEFKDLPKEITVLDSVAILLSDIQT